MKRILIKLSGEALAHEGSRYDTGMLDSVVEQIKLLQSRGTEVAIVVGGGNLFRGKELVNTISVKRPTADYIGMLAIVQNALVLRDYFEEHDVPTRVSSAIAMQQVCEPYIPNRCVRHLEKGRVVILAAGLGQPFFSSDTTCIQRALELSCTEVVMAKNGVDGVYTADPNKDPSARKIPTLTATEIIEQGLNFADHAAISLARENRLSLRVIGMNDMARLGEPHLGTTILAK